MSILFLFLLFSNFSKKNKQVINFLELANQEFSDAIIPFTADELTIQVAAISLATKPSDGFRLFSNSSIVDVGYIKCTYEQIAFYDHLNIDDPDKKLPIFPDLGIPSDLLSYFSDFPGFDIHKICYNYYLCVCVCVCVYVCVCMFVCLYAFMCMCVYIQGSQVTNISLTFRACMYVCMYVYVCIYVCMCECVCMYVCMYV